MKIKNFFWQYITLCFRFIATLSQNTRNYFKNGSFVIAIYPYLMHPCFRKMDRFIKVLLGILAAYGGVFYLFGEHVAILFSERSITAYVHHSTLELFFPLGTVIDGKENTLSNFPEVLRVAFGYQAYLIVPFYLFAIYPLSRKRLWLLEFLLALCFAIGTALVAEITSGRYTEGGLQNFGLSLTIILGNLMLLIIGFDLNKSSTPRLKKSTLWLGFVGIACVSVTLGLPSLFSPILERISLYTIMIWEIVAGFSVVQHIFQTGESREEEDEEDEVY